MINYRNSIGFMLLKIEEIPEHDMILKEIYYMMKKNLNDNIVLFSSECNKINTYGIPILHTSHAKFFSGHLWVFDMMSIMISDGFPNLSSRIYYTNSIQWIQQRTTMYKEWKNIYLNNNLQIVTTTQYLFDIYKICWKQPLGIMESFNHEKIQDFIR